MTNKTDNINQRTICWFSCGAASAVSTKLILEESPGAIVAYQHPGNGSEHPDNMRFLKDCEKWFGKKILIQQSNKYKNHWDVYKKEKYLVSPKGAMCTTVLKRKVAREILNIDDIEVFGYTVDEFDRFENIQLRNPERNFRSILIERGLTKADCLGMLAMADIEIPAMYKMGYKNNNCIGCVKGGAGYWNKIRVDFPGVFRRMAKQEREIGISILRRKLKGTDKTVSVYLDELEPTVGNYKAEEYIECGLMCQIKSNKLQLNLIS